jgi:hypothetical protein
LPVENDGNVALHPGAEIYFAPTIFGSVRHVRQRMPRPILPLPLIASRSSAWPDPAAASRAATSGVAKLVPLTFA